MMQGQDWETVLPLFASASHENTIRMKTTGQKETFDPFLYQKVL